MNDIQRGEAKSNQENATVRIFSTLLFSILAVAVSYVISFVLTSYISSYVGTEAYGFVSLAKTISNYGVIVADCLNVFASRFIVVSYHKGDLKKANIYFSSVVIANIALLVATLIFEVFFIWKLQVFINIPENLISDVKILFSLDITNYMALVLGNTFAVSAYIKNRLDKVELIKFISYLIEALILIALFKWLPAKIYYVGIGLLASTLVLSLFNFILCKRYTPELRSSHKCFSWRAVKDLVVNGIWNSINDVGNLLNSGLDLWVSNLMLSALAMGQLSIVKTVSTILSTLGQLLCKPFCPYLLKKYTEKDIHGLTRILNFEIKFSGYFTSMVCAGLFTFGLAYYKLWTPSENHALLYGLTNITAVGFLFEGIVHPLFFTYTLTLKNKVPCWVTVGSGLLNVLSMFLLLKFTNLGLYAVVGTTTVLGFFTFMIFTPLYTSHCLNVKWFTFYGSILRVVLAASFITVVLRVCFQNNMPSSWLGLILDALLSCFIGLPIFCVITLNKNDFLSLKNRLKKRNK